MQSSTIEITLGFICSFSITGKLLKSPTCKFTVGFNILKTKLDILVPIIPKMYFNLNLSSEKADIPETSCILPDSLYLILNPPLVINDQVIASLK